MTQLATKIPTDWLQVKLREAMNPTAEEIEQWERDNGKPTVGIKISDHKGIEHTLSVPKPDTTKNDPCAEQAKKYPAYWKPLPKHWEALDVYRVCAMFPVSDNSGRIHHALKKLLVPGVRTGGKSMHKDIREAVVTLNAWLADNPEA